MSVHSPTPPDEAAIYDSVASPESADDAVAPAPARTPGLGRSATAVYRAPSMAITIGTLAVLLVTSVVVLVSGLAMVNQSDAAQPINLAVITIGGSLVIWHLRAVIAGSGRRTAMISPWPWIGLLVVAAFGVTLGFALFDLLTGVRSAARVALLLAGVLGMVAGLIAFMRDADLADRPAPPAPVSTEVVQPEPIAPKPEPVYFDPTGADEARPIAARPRRGGDADASLWSEPTFEEAEPPRRARRSAEG